MALTSFQWLSSRTWLAPTTLDSADMEEFLHCLKFYWIALVKTIIVHSTYCDA